MRARFCWGRSGALAEVSVRRVSWQSERDVLRAEVGEQSACPPLPLSLLLQKLCSQPTEVSKRARKMHTRE